MPDCDCPDIPSEDSCAHSVREFRIADRSRQSFSRDSCSNSDNHSRTSASLASPSLSISAALSGVAAARAQASQKQTGVQPNHIIWGKVEASSSDLSSSNDPTELSRKFGMSKEKFFQEVKFLEQSSEEPASGDAPLSRKSAPPKARPAGITAAAVRAPASAASCGSGDAWGTAPRQAAPPKRQGGGARHPVKPLSQEVFEALVPQIPVDESGALTSVGSIAHAHGTCKPCAFAREKSGCDLGARCQFCHLPHRGKDLKRLGKGKRHRYRDLVARKTAEMGLDDDQHCCTEHDDEIDG